jgi:ComF family protein
MWKKAKNFILDLLYPKFCFNCGREGSYLCLDCQATLEISSIHTEYRTRELKDLYFALPYQKSLIKNLIQKFKYQPFIKELARNLTSLIITHFQLIEKSPTDFANFILIPIPLEKKKLKWRGFNQAEEIAKELSSFLKIPLISDVLIKAKETLPQVELSDEERGENIKGVFSYQHPELVKGRKILLVDDVYTTGSTMEECARVLKTAGAKEIIGIVVARG